MLVLLTGANGQLGQALMVAKPKPIELIAYGRAELDLASPQACSEAVRFYRPDWVLNAGAYTAVDKAESEPELALAVNAGAPAAFAEALAATLDSGSLPDIRALGRRFMPDPARVPAIIVQLMPLTAYDTLSAPTSITGDAA